MSVHRRRQPSRERAHAQETQSPRESKPIARNRSAAILVLFVLFAALIVCVRWFRQAFRDSRDATRPILSADVPPDDEDAISAGALPLEDHIPPNFEEAAVACMPTVTRSGVEYVSNAVKSWRLATNGSENMRRLIVFEMDVPLRETEPAWVRSVFASAGAALPTWLSVRKRLSAEAAAPRKRTLGDSEGRVRWRSKEALDYAEVVERCAGEASGRYVVVVQDDVLFRGGMGGVVGWADRHVVDVETESGGRRRTRRACGGSLFDVARAESRRVDGHLLEGSNMVARVWRVEQVQSLGRYVRANYDEAPVDWLADRRCRSRRGRTVVMEPNPVRHRGRVSSFAENEREGTLT